MKFILFLAITCYAGEWRKVPEDTVIDNLCLAVQTVKKDTTIDKQKVTLISVKKVVEIEIKMVKIKGRWYTK
jgi:hypothetical protein